MIQLKQKGISILLVRIVAKRELGFTIGIEKDLLCLRTPRLDIIVNVIKKRYKNEVRYILSKHYDFLLDF